MSAPTPNHRTVSPSAHSNSPYAHTDKESHRVIILGATSGLGRSLAERFISAGWQVGVSGRNSNALSELQALAPDRVITSQIDVCTNDATARLDELIKALGGMDIYLHCPGILLDNPLLDADPEVRVTETNATAFARMTSTAFKYFRDSRLKGRLVAISSVAGCRGLAELPAYSASKAFDQTYLEALRQLADKLKMPIDVVDIRPGWTRTPLLESSRSYLMEMDAETVTAMIFKAVLKARRVATIGVRWRILTFFEKLIPSCLWAKLHIPLWKEK